MAQHESTKSEPRRSFVFYTNWRHAISFLPDLERLAVYESIMDHAEHVEVRKDLSPACQMALNFILQDFDENRVKYDAKVERLKEIGKRGGLAKARNMNLAEGTVAADDTESEQMLANASNNASKSKHTVASMLQDKDKDKDKEEDKDKDKDNKKVIKLVRGGAASAATNELKIRMTEFRDLCRSYVGKYDHAMLENFYYFWSEPTPDKTKMKWELEKTWSIIHRLRAWKSREAPGKGSAKPALKTALQSMSEADIVAQQEARDREAAEREKDAISYEEHLRIVELEKQGYACDGKGNILGVRKELEAQGWVFDEWGRVKVRPKT